mgnify:CR=1 FL=1
MRRQAIIGIVLIMLLCQTAIAQNVANQATQYIDQQKVKLSKQIENAKADTIKRDALIKDIKSFEEEQGKMDEKKEKKDYDKLTTQLDGFRKDLKKIGVIPNVKALSDQLRGYDGLGQNEVMYTYYTENYLKELQDKVLAAQSKAKGSKNPQDQQALNAAQDKLSAAQKEAYRLEKDARKNRADREANLMLDEVSDLTKKVEGKEQELAALKESKASKEDIAKLTAEIAALAAKREATQIALDKKKGEQKYLNGETTVAQTLTDIVEAYSQYSGMGAFASLFIDDSELSKRRQEANDLFCSTWLLGGVECWSSKLCQYSVDAKAGGLGLMARTTSQAPVAGAHIEADKSLPIQYTNLTNNEMVSMKLYRITYYLHNPNTANITYNLKFTANDGSVYTAFQYDKILEEGSTTKQIRTNAIVKYSNREYTKVCLTFNPAIKRFGGGETKELCNDIIEYSGQATSVTGAATTTGTAATQTTSSDFGGF